MTHGARLLLCTLAGLTLGSPAPAATDSGSPYQGIVDRNVFGLKAPPPPPDPEANKPPPPKIFLTGITTILGYKRALMKLTPPAKPGQPVKEETYTLGEGQRDGDLEVLEIDEKAGRVKVNEFGTVATLSFESNGVKTASSPGPVAPPQPGGFVPRPGGNPFTPGMARPNRMLPTGYNPGSPASRGLTPAYGGGASSYGGAPAYGASAPNVALGGASMPLYGTTPAQTQPQPQPQTAAQQTQLAAQQAQSQMTAEQQFLMVEAYRQKMQESGVSIPPIPPTPLSSALNPGASGARTPPPLPQ